MTEHTSLELSKRLHDKGFRIEYKSFWIKDGKTVVLVNGQMPRLLTTGFPAYTFSELWAVVPWIIWEEDGSIELEFYKGRDNSCATYVNYDLYGQKGKPEVEKEHESPAEALGLLVEWLIDEGHLIGKGE